MLLCDKGNLILYSERLSNDSMNSKEIQEHNAI